MRSYSSGVRPCSAISSGVMAGSADTRRWRVQGGDEAFENQAAIVLVQGLLSGALRMRHHAGHIACGVADAGDVLERSVGLA